MLKLFRLLAATLFLGTSSHYLGRIRRRGTRTHQEGRTSS